MLRNRSYRRLCIALFAVGLPLCIGGFVLHPLAGAGALAGMGLVFFFVWQFARRQFSSMQKLSRYMERICAGEYHLDIRDNEEGEWSILKNDIYKMTLTLREQAQQLCDDKQMLADAISDISHQLKTPLSGMQVMTDLLADPSLEEEKRVEFTQNIQLQLERMEWLLTSLLKLAKIDAGSIQFHKDPVVLKELFRKAAAPLLVPMELKSLAFEAQADDGASFTGDLHWTAEALVNILKNCVEHTPEGGRIRISGERNHLYTVIRVEDTGPGIREEDLPYLFDRFYKGANSSEDSVGIGLAMAKSIVKSQNGTLRAICTGGHGAVFELRFYEEVV